jgi:hypothetical protein
MGSMAFMEGSRGREGGVWGQRLEADSGGERGQVQRGRAASNVCAEGLRRAGARGRGGNGSSQGVGLL